MESIIWHSHDRRFYSFFFRNNIPSVWARFAPQATLQLLTIEALYTLFGFKAI
jgi:hypothetical protein